MPRVKLVYQEHGEWAPAVSTIGVCKHPRERLRFDGSFSAPSFMYCRDCGTRYIHPHHGLSDWDIMLGQAYARDLMIDLGMCDKDGNRIEQE